MTSKLVVNTIESDTGISSVSFASSISMSSTSKFHFSAAGIDIGADTNINRPAAGVLGFNINGSQKVVIRSNGKLGIGTDNPQQMIEVQDRSGGTLIGLSVGTQHGNASFGGYNNYPAIMNNASQPLIYCDTNNDRTIFFGDTVGFGTTCAFRVNGAERLRINSDGQVLIGETSVTGGGVQKLVIGNGGAENFEFSPAMTSNNLNGGLIEYLHRGDGNTRPDFNLYTGGAGNIKFYTSGNERMRIKFDGKIGIGTVTPSEILHIMKNDTTGPTITLQNNVNSAYINNWGSAGGGSGRTNRFEINATSLAQASYCAPYHTFMTGGVGDNHEKLRIMPSGTLKALYHATSRNGIVQIKQVTTTTRYSGSPSSVDLITSSTMTPKTSAPRFLIMIFCPVNTSDDSDAGGGNTNFYFYGRLEYRKNSGSWLECNDQGSTNEQGGYAAHIELSPNRTGPNTTDYWSGNRYRTESKTATILVTNVGDCGSNGTVEFKLRCYSYSGNFIQIGQPHGNGTDDNYGVQPWGFTVFELAPDNNTYTAY